MMPYCQRLNHQHYLELAGEGRLISQQILALSYQGLLHKLTWGSIGDNVLLMRLSFRFETEGLCRWILLLVSRGVVLLSSVLFLFLYLKFNDCL